MSTQQTLIPTAKKPVNYLANKDILVQIHLSKNTYCQFTQPEYHQYDFIVDYLDNSSLEANLEYACREETILQAKTNRALRLDAVAGNPKGTTPPESIDKEDLIIRVMTWAHIPLAPKAPKKVTKKKSAKEIFDFGDEDDSFADLEVDAPVKLDDLVHVRVNFPPFQHYKFDGAGSLICVGKSHWEGDMVTGEFARDKGQITNTLAKMYLKLCERYGTKWNWRGYSYNDEMVSSALLQLTYVGLRFNEAKGSNPFAYLSAVLGNAFCRVLNTEKRSQSIRDDLMEANGIAPSFTRQFQEEYAREMKRMEDTAGE
jgi:hypothetical protein